jgi:hypothetical protein
LQLHTEKMKVSSFLVVEVNFFVVSIQRAAELLVDVITRTWDIRFNCIEIVALTDLQRILHIMDEKRYKINQELTLTMFQDISTQKNWCDFLMILDQLVSSTNWIFG